MLFDSKFKIAIVVVFIGLTIISIIGMGIVTTAIFDVENNIITISDSKLVMGKIALSFYWGLCAIATTLITFNYIFKN
jgi:hypothetical protein